MMNRQLPSGTQFLCGIVQSVSLEAATAFDMLAAKDKRIVELEAEVAALKPNAKTDGENVPAG